MNYSFLYEGAAFSASGVILAAFNLFQCLLDCHYSTSKRRGLGDLQRTYHILLLIACLCFSVSELCYAISMIGVYFTVASLLFYLMIDIGAVALLSFYSYTTLAFYSSEKFQLEKLFFLKLMFRFGQISIFIVQLVTVALAYIQDRYFYCAFGNIYVAVVVALGVILMIFYVAKLFESLRELEAPIKKRESVMQTGITKKKEESKKDNHEQEKPNAEKEKTAENEIDHNGTEKEKKKKDETASQVTSITADSPLSPNSSPPLFSSLSIDCSPGLTSSSTPAVSPIRSDLPVSTPLRPLRPLRPLGSSRTITSSQSLSERMSRYSRFVYILVFFSMVVCGCVIYSASSAFTHFDQPFYITEISHPSIYYVVCDLFSIICLILVTYTVWIPIGGLKKRGTVNGNANGNQDDTFNASFSSHSQQPHRNHLLTIFKEIAWMILRCECWQACLCREKYQEKKMRSARRTLSPLCSANIRPPAAAPTPSSAHTPVHSSNAYKPSTKPTATVGIHHSNHSSHTAIQIPE